VIGGSLFALGAAEAQLGSGDASTTASIYLAGGVFFSTGGYATVLLALNGGARATRWRWWGYQRRDLTWLSALVLFAGTLAFGISLISAFINGLRAHGVDRLVWRPEFVGCVLFLVSGHLGMRAICRRPLPCTRWRELDWWLVAVNQLGSILFMVSAVAAFIRPETGDEINVALANWGTLTGALCFAIGGVIQAFDPPPPRLAPVDVTRSG
jgi:hypothetical protein